MGREIKKRRMRKGKGCHREPIIITTEVQDFSPPDIGTTLPSNLHSGGRRKGKEGEEGGKKRIRHGGSHQGTTGKRGRGKGEKVKRVHTGVTGLRGCTILGEKRKEKKKGEKMEKERKEVHR